MRVRRTLRWSLVGVAGAAVVGMVATGVQAAELTELPAWGTVDSPNASERQNALTDVYAATPDEAWAVGYANEGASPRTLLQHWDGESWSQVQPPELPGGRIAELSAVNGTGPDDVWAVGTAVDATGDSEGDRTVTLHWDGQDWTAVSSPNQGFEADNNELSDVVAIAPDDVWAVGEFDGSSSGSGFGPILQHWNGTRWQAAPAVDHPCGIADLYAIDAAGSNDVWAIGEASACHFDGSSWTPAQPELPGGNYQLALADVTVFDSGEALAVGRTFSNTGPCEGPGGGGSNCLLGEVQRWDGARWSSVETLDFPLNGMAVLSENEIWAATDHGMRYFDGTEWTRVPDPNSNKGELSGVSASGPDDIWAVGTTSFLGSPSDTVVQHAPSFDSGTVVGTTGNSQSVVSWTGPSEGSVEDTGSGYEVADLPAGTYDFIVTAPNCAPDSRSVEVVAGQIIQEDFEVSC